MIKVKFEYGKSEHVAKALRSVSKEFIAHMAKAIILSHFKYGDANKTYPSKHQAHYNIPERYKKYLETGNTEWLVDIANFAMLEFMFPSLPNAHFRSTDSDESPGLV